MTVAGNPMMQTVKEAADQLESAAAKLHRPHRWVGPLAMCRLSACLRRKETIAKLRGMKWSDMFDAVMTVPETPSAFEPLDWDAE